MKKVILLFALMSALCAQSLSAQVIKGDMNDDGVFDIGDVSESVNTVIGKRAIQYVQGGDPYMVDNSRVVGTWYKTKKDYFTLNADGTTDYVSGRGDVKTYEFLPYQGCILFYDASLKPVTFIDVKSLIPGRMVCLIDEGEEFVVLTTEVPALPVTSIQLSSTSVEMLAGEFKQITATVLPADADNKLVAWESSNESVAKVMGDLILAMGYGTAVITCSATDGSGVKAECTVTVKNKDMSGKDSAGREYVDLDLPGGVLWATYNVGASKPEDFGLYFAWGETTGYAKDGSHSFNWANYDLCNGSSDKITKYCTRADRWDYSLGTSPDGKTVLDPEDDAATVNWGDGWRMPTIQEVSDLTDRRYTTTEWVTLNGVFGRKITSRSNGNSIFMPAAGLCDGTGLSYEEKYGYYWSSSRPSSINLSTEALFAWCLEVGYAGYGVHDFSRINGHSVRAVRVASE